MNEPKLPDNYYIDELTGALYIDEEFKGFAHIEYDIEQEKEVLIISPLWNED